jgi:4-hydroxy-tetrahydrodipicolinate synthase
MSSMDNPIRGGVYVPIITPFAKDGSIDVEALERLAARILADGAAGLVPLGTTGEAPLLDDQERRVVVDACARVTAERGAQLIVGAGSNSTAQTVDAVRALEGTPTLAAVLCLVPYYLRPTQAGIAAHFEQVAQASPVPVVIYNIPFRTGQRADATTLLHLAKHENIVGVKQSVGGIDNDSLRLLAEAPEGFAVLGGDDAHLAALVLLGGAGGITASAHLRTPDWVAMVDAAREAGHLAPATITSGCCRSSRHASQSRVQRC